MLAPATIGSTVAVHPQRHDQRDADRRGDRAQRKPQVVPQRLPEHRIVTHDGIVLQAHETRRTRALGRGEKAVPKRRQRRVMRERGEQHDGWQQ
ncbi:hypothetical protein G6F31_015775 [Rhizopus arrhizus]|nr:hypothetical protein G6F31_015775 [Rhizopus arrhizus]